MERGFYIDCRFIEIVGFIEIGSVYSRSKRKRLSNNVQLICLCTITIIYLLNLWNSIVPS